MSPEVWKDIPGYEGRYQVSDQGRVRSLDRRCAATSKRGKVFYRWHPGRVLSPGKNTSEVPYQYVTLHTEKQNFLVHRLVLLAFVGPCPLGMEARHLDCDYQNNSLSNLTYGTHMENMADSLVAGHTTRKLTPRQVREIRARIASGEPNLRICKDYGVSDVVISNIKLGRTYREILDI